ncbi:hypothetical protein Hanom_Chr02g00133751 [Helianthus anomalus]
MRLQPAILTRDRSHQSPHHKQEHTTHRVNNQCKPVSSRDFIRFWREKVIPNCLELFRGRPGPRNTPRQ